MKNILSVFLCVLLVFALCSCGGNEAPSKENTEKTDAVTDTETKAVTETTNVQTETKLSIFVETPEGWERNTASVLEHQYMKYTSSLMIKYENFQGKTLDAVVSEAETIFDDTFDDFTTVGDREYIQVGGKDAVKITFTCKVGNYSMKYTYVYLFLNNSVCVITLGDLAATFDSMSSDYDYILDHITFSA